MAFLGFRQPSAVADQDAAIADREAAWNSLRRDIDPSMMALNFGLNLMANSETQGLGSAIGNAGMDALKTHNAIMQARQAQANAMQAREDKLQQHRDTLAQNEIANTLARDRLNWDIEHGRNQDRYAEATLNSTLQKNGLDAYNTMVTIQRMNDARIRAGKAPLPMPSFPGMPSMTAAGASTGGTAVPGAPAAPFVARQDENGAWVLPGSRSADDIKNLLANGTVAGMDPKIAELIEAEAIRQGVNPTLAKAVAMQESSGNHQANIKPNSAGAVGLFQVIPGHAAEYGMKPEDAFDLNGNIKYGIAELKKKLALNGGDINSALLGYNWGQGNVDAYRKNGRGVKGQAVPKEAYEYADRVFSRITPGQQPAVQPETPAGQQKPASYVGAPDLQAPISIRGQEVTPDMLATWQDLASTYPDLPEGKEAEKLLGMYKDEVERRAKFAKDNRETGVKMNDVAGLGSKWASESSSYNNAVDGLSQLLATAKNGDPMSDVAMVFNFMKALDPNSVVREGEFATAKNAGGVDQRILSLYNDALGNGMLTPEKRQMLVKTAMEIVKARRNGQSKINSRYKKIADQYGVDPSLIIADDQYVELEPMLEEYLKGTPSAGKSNGSAPAIPGIPSASSHGSALKPYQGGQVQAGSTLVFGADGKIMGVR